MNDRAQAILDFWFDDLIVEKRFKKDEKFDQLIREKFGEDHNKATSNEYDYWQDEPLTCLLYTSPSPRDLYRSRMPSSA